MQISIDNSGFQTLIFTVILLGLSLLSLKKEPQPHLMDISNTNELKGLAILMVIFSHIGYFLDSADKFLYPLSVAGGIGVNIFLFLSGYGLTMSSLKSKLSPLAFYIKHFRKIFIPMWLISIFFLVLDLCFLSHQYPPDIIFKGFFGFFPNADIYTSFNSPLWYFTLAVFYYLIFPLFFFRKFPIISVLLILLLSFFIFHFNLITSFVDKDVLKLYKLHYLAFPIGISLAIVQSSRFSLTSLIKGANPVLKYYLIGVLVLSISYTAINSGVGENVQYEQSISLITMISFILIILLKNWQSKFLIMLGVYSYEIYLIQWPLLYRYDFLYKYLPAYLATVLYLGLFLVVGYLIKKLTKNLY